MRELTKDDYVIEEEGIFSVEGAGEIGARVQLSEEVLEAEFPDEEFNVWGAIETFRNLVQKCHIVEIPQLTKRTSFSTGEFSDRACKEMPFQHLHRDKEGCVPETAFTLYRKRPDFATLYVPNEILDLPGFPKKEVTNPLIPDEDLDFYYQYIMSENWGVLLNQEPGTTIISNLTGVHGRTRLSDNPGKNGYMDGYLSPHET